MKKIAVILLIPLVLASQPILSEKNTEKAALTSLLNDFLAGQSYEHHDRFWADDLIYTSSAGLRFDKKFIMDGMSKDDTKDEDTSEKIEMIYSAEEVDIRIYGTTAIVAFKLVGTEIQADVTSNNYYFNTGTFLKRNNKWQAIAWQATKIPAK